MVEQVDELLLKYGRCEKGDVVVIPAGVPHWFKEVSGPLTYFVVKPISMSGGAR
jgi:pyruvate kinase